MKRSYLLLLCLAASALSYGQQKKIEFGSVDKADLLMTQHPKEKTAPAMILSEVKDIIFDWDEALGTFVMQTIVHKQIKIFNDKGLDYATVKLMYVNDDKYERVLDIAGNVYNLDNGGEIVTTKLAKDQIYKQKENEVYNSVKFSMPGIKPGSVLEYRYTVIKKSFSDIDPWIIQHEIPTRLSRFIIEVPEVFTYRTNLVHTTYGSFERVTENKVKVIPVDRSSVRMNVTQFTLTARDIDALYPEPYMTTFSDYFKRVEFQLTSMGGRTVSNGWSQVAEYLNEDFYFGRQLEKRISIPAIDSAVKNMTGDAEKVKYIHHYVRDHFKWDGVEDFRSLNVKKINREREGSTGDINLLLTNLLQSNGIEAYPLLVSTRDNGDVNQAYPTLRQFNTLYVFVIVNGKSVIINGADKYTPTDMVPYDAAYTKGLQLDKKTYHWRYLVGDDDIDKQTVSFMATIAEDGSVKGNAYIINGGYAKIAAIKELKSGNEKYVDAHYSNVVPGIAIEDYTVKNTDNDTLDIVQQFNFNFKTSGSGGYLYFNTNLFTGLEKNPFVAEKRVSDIHFGVNRRLTLNARIVLPEGYQPDTLPENLRVIMPDSSITFTRSYYFENDVITLRQTLEFDRPSFDAKEYPEFRMFYKKLYDMLNEQIVLKKKN